MQYDFDGRLEEATAARQRQAGQLGWFSVFGDVDDFIFFEDEYPDGTGGEATSRR